MEKQSKEAAKKVDEYYKNKEANRIANEGEEEDIIDTNENKEEEKVDSDEEVIQ